MVWGDQWRRTRGLHLCTPRANGREFGAENLQLGRPCSTVRFGPNAPVPVMRRGQGLARTCPWGVTPQPGCCPCRERSGRTQPSNKNVMLPSFGTTSRGLPRLGAISSPATWFLAAEAFVSLRPAWHGPWGMADRRKATGHRPSAIGHRPSGMGDGRIGLIAERRRPSQPETAASARMLIMKGSGPCSWRCEGGTDVGYRLTGREMRGNGRSCWGEGGGTSTVGCGKGLRREWRWPHRERIWDGGAHSSEGIDGAMWSVERPRDFGPLGGVGAAF